MKAVRPTLLLLLVLAAVAAVAGFGRCQPGRRRHRDRRRHRAARGRTPRSPRPDRHPGAQHRRVLLPRGPEGAARLVPERSAVGLETDPGLDQVDRYGRLLRYLRRGGVNVNLELVRQGAAAPYFYGGDLGRYARPAAVGGEGCEGRQARAVGCVPGHGARSVQASRDAAEGRDPTRHRSAERL